MVSHAPQLLLSVFRSAQALLHIVPEVHVNPQLVQSHVAVEPAGGTHAAQEGVPQLAGEPLLTHTPRQRCCPVGQLQRPCTQLSPRAQVVLQSPQCVGSFCVSKQLAPHCVSVPQL